MPLNEYLENNKIDKIDILKIDTEGMSLKYYKVLKIKLK